MLFAMTENSREIRLVVAAFAAAVILSNIALLDFYVGNVRELDGPGQVVQYAACATAITVLCAALIKWLLPNYPWWRVLLAVGLTVFVFCSYHVTKTIKWRGEGWWLAPVWIAITIAAGLMALVALRRSGAVSVILVLSLAFAAPAVARIVVNLVKTQGRAAASSEFVASAGRNRITPNIYWIVLDGYPRRDVLRDSFGFDNSGFVEMLATLDFAVLESSFSNFPVTAYSISSTLNMDYTVQTNGGQIEPFPLLDIYPMIRGKGRVVSRLKAAGYNYVHFENGYDYLTKCAIGERRCVKGKEGSGRLDELDVAILSNTPIIDLVTDFEEITGKADAPVFAWGGVDDLGAKLDAIEQTPAPFFLYAHVLAPHPPMRFRADCSALPAEPDLQAWNPAARPAFIDQLKCTNTQTETLLRRIVRADPAAIVILQSDHGTAFSGQFAKQPTDWSDADLHERFGALNAMRLPAECRGDLRQDLSLIDTFPLVFSCLTGEGLRPRPPRFFVTPYDGGLGSGRVVEYPAERVQGSLEVGH